MDLMFRVAVFLTSLLELLCMYMCLHNPESTGSLRRDWAGGWLATTWKQSSSQKWAANLSLEWSLVAGLSTRLLTGQLGLGWTVVSPGWLSASLACF